MRSIFRLTRMFLLILAAGWLLSVLVQSEFGNNSIKAEAIPDPVQRSEEEVYQFLQEKATEDQRYAAIMEHPSEYPEPLLASLANNPEMMEFVEGYPEKQGTVSGTLTWKEKKSDYPLFLQWDSRWGYQSYGSSNVGVSGCGPTCLSMVIYALTRNESATPDQIASFAEQRGYYIEGTGTAWALMTDGAAAYDVTSQELALDEALMKKYLQKGDLIICAMGPGNFTAAGHFIMIYGYKNGKFLVNDPNSRYRSQKEWDYATLKNQIKALWCFYT